MSKKITPPETVDGQPLKNNEQTSALDPLDMPSDCYLERDGKLIMLTFRELAAACEKDMVKWDSLSPGMRAMNQRANDRDWRPIQPGAGLRRYRRWRG